MFRRFLTAGLVLLALSFPAHAVPEESPKPEAVLAGRLVHQGKTPHARANNGKTYRLVSSDEFVNAILNEPRVAGREMQFEGRWKDPGAFEVTRLFRLRDGKLYKIVYFCDVCNITSYKPGRCACCQEETEVREFLHEPRDVP